ncbi:MAG: DUF2383 domain-containing protein [Polyangiaceae bacterium]
MATHDDLRGLHLSGEPSQDVRRLAEVDVELRLLDERIAEDTRGSPARQPRLGFRELLLDGLGVLAGLASGVAEVKPHVGASRHVDSVSEGRFAGLVGRDADDDLHGRWWGAVGHVVSFARRRGATPIPHPDLRARTSTGMRVAPPIITMEMTMKDPALVQRPETLAVLDKLLRGELAAVATYDHALENVTSTSLLRVLRENHASHAARVAALAAEIDARGGEPSRDAGPWGVLTKLLEAGAAAIGDDAVAKVLDEGETLGMQTYELEAPRLKDEAAVELAHKLTAEQKRTSARMSHHAAA